MIRVSFERRLMAKCLPMESEANMDNAVFKTIDEYISGLSQEARLYLEEIRKIVHDTVPEAEELINYNMPAFALRKGGKRDQQIMVAGYKKHVGLYPHPATMMHFKETLAEYKTGKGSVQFPLDKPLPKQLIADMVKYLKEQIDKTLK